ncbi:hypothetical protein BWR59_17185 [Pseudomonas sp. Bc-h]|uniref:hypothetical protein n=1 Tax=Pseudomonas sp. Bc-h TaxID=1943632 RepID=UPI0009DA10EC|nr:hypothetical protein [Pseudomonas sp. Bc-h]OQR30290.1 hypothetical protein BWR59_17185 [Pseudomonas sp. Bc-h]
MEKTAAAKHSADYRARQKAEKQKLGVEILKVAVPVGINRHLQKLMKAHGFKNKQELYQTVVLSLVGAEPDEAKRMLTLPPSGFVVTEKLARQLKELGMADPDPDADADEE